MSWIGTRPPRAFVLGVVFAAAMLTRSFAADGDPPDARFVPPTDLPEGWYARLETTEGRILARLLPEQAPQAVAHFYGLAEGTLEWSDPVTGEPRKAHFYDGIQVDRAVAGQRFEAGGLDGVPDRVPPRLYLSPDDGHGPVDFASGGRLGMTRAIGDRISAVKFFVTAAPQPVLNRQYPCFGIVVQGRDVVFDISQVRTHSNGRPITPVVIREIRVFKVGEPAALPEPEPYRPSPKRFHQRETP